MWYIKLTHAILGSAEARRKGCICLLGYLDHGFNLKRDVEISNYSVKSSVSSMRNPRKQDKGTHILFGFVARGDELPAKHLKTASDVIGAIKDAHNVAELN